MFYDSLFVLDNAEDIVVFYDKYVRVLRMQYEITIAKTSMITRVFENNQSQKDILFLALFENY